MRFSTRAGMMLLVVSALGMCAGEVAGARVDAAPIRTGATLASYPRTARFDAISEQEAIQAALRDAPWGPCRAISASRLRLTQRTDRTPAGSWVWAVNVRPRSPVYPPSVGPDPVGIKRSHKPTRSRPDNYFVVVINARTDRFISATEGRT